MANKPFKGKGGPKPPRKQFLSISGLEIGDVKPVGVGEFEVNINLMIVVGKFPAHGAQYQWLVDGHVKRQWEGRRNPPTFWEKKYMRLYAYRVD